MEVMRNPLESDNAPTAFAYTVAIVVCISFGYLGYELTGWWGPFILIAFVSLFIGITMILDRRDARK